MIETIGRQLEDVVLGQRLFSDIEVCKNWPNCSTIIFIQILLLDSQSISFLSLFLEMIFLQFALDDGVVHAHKPLLMARCDMMQVSDTMYNLPICQNLVLKQLISGDVFWQFPRKLRPLCSLPWSHMCHFQQSASLSLHRYKIVYTSHMCSYILWCDVEWSPTSDDQLRKIGIIIDYNCDCQLMIFDDYKLMIIVIINQW